MIYVIQNYISSNNYEDRNRVSSHSLNSEYQLSRNIKKHDAQPPCHLVLVPVPGRCCVVVGGEAA